MPPAPEYVDLLMGWVESQLNDETIFPIKFGQSSRRGAGRNKKETEAHSGLFGVMERADSDMSL